MGGAARVTFAGRVFPKGRWAIAALAVIAGLACLAGCFFEPRSAEPPSQSVSYIPATEPKAVLENLDTALRVRDASGYLGMIGDTFVYVPDTQAVSDYPAVDWGNWDRARESAFVNAFFNGVATVQSALQDSTIFAEGSSGTKVIWEFIYDIKTTSPPPQQSTTEYRGRAFLTLELVLNFWKLTKWEDEHGEAPRGGGGTLQTSGGLRGAFSNGGG
jgi:hypothetical protein